VVELVVDMLVVRLLVAKEVEREGKNKIGRREPGKDDL